MTTFRMTMLLAVSAMLALPASARADEAIKVSPFTVSESREATMHELARDKSSSLTLTLLLEGEAIKSVTHLGAVEVTAAADDKGNRLEGLSRGFSTRFGKINREHMWFFMDEKPRDKIKVDVRLEAPPRSAKALRGVAGSIKLRKVQTTDVFIGDLASKVGKQVDHAALKKLGVTLQIEKYEPQNRGEYIEFKLTDPKELVVDYALVDAKGEAINRAASAFGFGDSKTVDLGGGSKAAPANARLKLIVTTEQEEISVPFEVKAIELP